MKRIDGTAPVTRIAIDVPGAIAVFESLGIDYACAGDRTLDDAAHAAGFDPETVLAALRRLEMAEQATSWNDQPLQSLIGYLVAQHHRFVREELARLAVQLSAACAPAGDVDHDLLALRATFTQLSELLIPHMHHEERSVFPAIEAIESAWQSGEPMPEGADHVREHVRHVLDEHATISAQLRTMRELRLTLSASNSLTPRTSAMLESLGALEAHLHEYMFLENSVLLPRALAMEEQMRAPADRRP